MKNANLYSLKMKDFIKGFIMAMLTIVVTGIGVILNSGKFPTFEELKALALTGLAAGIAYVVKNFFTNSNDQFGKAETSDKMPVN